MPLPDLRIYGKSGLKRFGGEIFEEELPQLQGPKWIKIVKQMSEQDSVIGAILFAIEMLIRQIPMDVKPATNENKDHETADFVQTMFEDMSTSWENTLSEILTMLPYGWSYLELVYKYRQGDQRDPTKKSKHNDGKVGWRKWAIRSQDSWAEWDFAEDDDGVKGMWQQPPPDYNLRYIPIEKALLFNTTTRKGNPEGRSVLRTAYRSWYFRSRLENLEAVGVERDLAGFPVAWVPWEFLSENASAEQLAIVEQVKDIVTGIKRDEQEGAIMPRWYDKSGNLGFELELMASAGKRQFDTNMIIKRYRIEMAMSVLADFILLGHELVGSYALSDSKIDLFVTAVRAWVDAIADVINRYAIPRVLRLNGIPQERHPKVVFGAIERTNLVELSDYVSKLGSQGFIVPTPDLEIHLRQQADLPSPTSTSVMDAVRFPFLQQQRPQGPESNGQPPPGQNGQGQVQPEEEESEAE